MRGIGIFLVASRHMETGCKCRPIELLGLHTDAFTFVCFVFFFSILDFL